MHKQHLMFNPMTNFRFSILLLLYFPTLPLSASTTAIILEELKPQAIKIIGKSHQRGESVKLFKKLVTDALKKFQCVTVAL